MELLFGQGDLVRVQSSQENLLSGVALFMIPSTKKRRVVSLVKKGGRREGRDLQRRSGSGRVG